MTKGIIIIFVVLTLLAIGMNGVTNYIKSTPSPAYQKFMVVDRYDGRCNVVRYLPDGSGKYFYFLDCSK